MKTSDFQNLDFKNPGGWPQGVKFVAAVFVFAILAAFLYWFMIRQKRIDLDALRAEERTLVQTFEQKQQRVANLEDYRKQLESMKVLLRELVRQLPSKTEMPDLLRDISQTALATGIDNELFETGAETEKEYYAEKPIELRMVGTYHQFGSFMSGVASLPRVVILTMHDISLTPKTDANKATPAGGQAIDLNSSGLLVLKGTVKTYRYREEEGEDTLDLTPVDPNAPPGATPTAVTPAASPTTPANDPAASGGAK